MYAALATLVYHVRRVYNDGPPTYLEVMGMTTDGVGGSRFAIATMGAVQFEKGDDHASFFNWYFVVLFIGNAFSFMILIMYIEDNLSYGLGFGIWLVSTLIRK
ncbi:hypothetical protein F8388_026894 [Cannabis sativa]|uniref:Uncharacterized protein n=1 Tax=Cannabis sativa TaxID=3483 RepID=A0A7J6H258_CANSA|nr:hypothetical protein F8388_026894 [Cannabis sativa]